MNLIKNWLVTGDTHGKVAERLADINTNLSSIFEQEDTGIIILGDAGFNFWLNKTDKKRKEQVQKNFKYTVYCLRGNHEERPENIEGYHLVYDGNVQGMVWVEDEFPNIRFFVDGGEYVINGYSVLTIGGAYSVDKWYRLIRAGYKKEEEAIADPKKTGWFPSEMLTQEERYNITQNINNKKFDFVFTHTAPLEWEPIDLFLDFIDQSNVDKTMERWLNYIKDKIDWGIWLFGHYHANRIERPRVEQYYAFYDSLDDIWNRWHGKNPSILREWWLPRSPYMKEWEKENKK